jgi:hypothetical protein
VLAARHARRGPFRGLGNHGAIHRDLQPLRENAFDVAAFLRRAGVLFAFNHPLHFYRGQPGLDEYLRLVDAAPAVETRNGAMLRGQNDFAARLAVESGRSAIGGSDAHTLRRVGRTWTEAPGDTPNEFLAAIAAGRSHVGGDQGGTLPLAADIYGVIAQYWLSLVGLQRHEIGWGRRALGLAFSVTTAPFEFIPLLIAARQKQREARWIEICSRELEAAVAETPALPVLSPGP